MNATMNATMNADPLPPDVLAALAAVIESRKPGSGAGPQGSYVGQLLHRGSDAILKKIGEEAAEVIMAAKDADHGADKAPILAEMADLWFHCLVALGHYGLHPQQVLDVLHGRMGVGGLEEKAGRQVAAAGRA